MNGLLGRKLGMTQVYDADRRLIPVTVVEAGPCGVTAVRAKDSDGYDAIQLGFDEVPERKLAKPRLGHLRASKGRLWKTLKEFRGAAGAQVGDAIKVDIFQRGEKVDVQGQSKGKGFQGVIKRHHYSGGPASHGSMFHRAPGSIGSSSFPSRVLKNKTLPGQMGNERVTVKGLTVVDARPDENLLFISGAVPGPVGGLLVIKKIQKA